MIPHERSLVQRYQNQPFVLLGVNVNESRAKAQRFEEEHHLPWRSWWDGDSMTILKRWGVSGLPTVFLLDHKGVIRFISHGPPNPATLDQEIEKLVAAVGK